MHPLRPILGAGLLAVSLLIAPTPPATDAQLSGTWSALGLDDASIDAIALSPRWPEDRTILAIRARSYRQGVTILDPVYDLVRASDPDGGRWETFGLPSQNNQPFGRGIQFFAFAPYGPNRDAVFMLLVPRSSAAGQRPASLYRSLDAGATWTSLLELDPGANPSLVLSPSFMNDETAVVIAGGNLYWTRNGGSTWEVVAPTNGQRIDHVAFSPNVAVDHTVFLTARDGGAMVSNDGGLSWAGLDIGTREADKANPASIQQLLASPTYERDGKLFAIASYALESSSCGVRPDLLTLLLRSTDRGGTWEPIHSLAPGCAHETEVVFSPGFADDGGIFIVDRATNGYTPSSNACQIYRGDDRGERWLLLRQDAGRVGCRRIQAFGDPAEPTLAVQWSGETAAYPYLSLDRGATWTQLRGPADRRLAGMNFSRLSFAPSPTFARDRSIFVGGAQGLWRYEPVAIDRGGERWESISPVNAPAPRDGHTAIWADRQMIVWGGLGPGGPLADGATYLPEQDEWRPIATEGAPAARAGHTAVWTGSVMIVWGGGDCLGVCAPEKIHPAEGGGRLRAVGGRWSPVSEVDAPLGRLGHTAIWTGDRMIVWGGYTTDGYHGTGASYDPGTDSWTPISDEGAPSPRAFHSAVWTGKSMIVWGGLGAEGHSLGDGAEYDPSTDRWTELPLDGAPARRYWHTAVWTGEEMLIWGGGGFPTAEAEPGAIYRPADGSWRPVTFGGQPSRRYFHTAVWTGREMVIWGGLAGFASHGDGARYSPDRDHWLPLTGVGNPRARHWHSAVWAGDRMIIWGGHFGGRAPEDLRDGDSYFPGSRDVQGLDRMGRAHAG